MRRICIPLFVAFTTVVAPLVTPAAAQEGAAGLEPLVRAPIAVSDDGRTVLYVAPGADGDWQRANAIHRYDVPTATDTRLLESRGIGRFTAPAIRLNNRMAAVQFQRGDRPSSGRRSEFDYRELLLLYLPGDPTAAVEATGTNLLPPRHFARGDMTPAFSQDGDYLYLAFGPRHDGSRGNYSTQQIYRLSASGEMSSALRRQRLIPKADEFCPTPAGDAGQYIITLVQGVDTGSPVRLFRRELVGEERLRADMVATPIELPEPAGVTVPMQHVFWPAAAAGTDRVVCQVGGWNLWSLVLVDASGARSPRVLLEGTRTTSWAYPSLSPGGRWLVCEEQTIEMAAPPVPTATVRSRRVVLVNVHTGEQTVLAENARYPVLAPDGQHVFCFRQQPDGRGGQRWAFAVIPMDNRIPPRDLGRLDPDERERLVALVSQLGDDDYSTRRTATEQLKEFGERALTEMQRQLLIAEDPEIILRLTDVIAFLASDPPQRPNDPR